MNTPSPAEPHWGLMNAVSSFFPLRADVMAATISRDAVGAPTQTWADVDGWTNVQAARGNRAVTYTDENGFRRAIVETVVLLKANLPVTVENRLTIESVTYRVIRVEHDEHRLLTALTVEAVV